jgi:glycosyltransferase involved in cell wall biosynthesis
MADPKGTLPFFSVVIPYYNRFDLAVSTIDSVLRQKFSGYEIIIVDDGSTDGSGSKIKNHYQSENKIRVIHQANLERGAARNKGFRESKGTYVIFLDSDDLFLEHHLDVLYSKIRELNFPDFISTKFLFFRDNKRIESGNSILKEGFYDYHLFLNGNPMACNVCVRKANEGLFLFEEDRSYAMKEDWMFYLQNLRFNKLYLVDRVTLLFLDHDERSVQGNYRHLIERTQLSRQWVLKHVELDPAEQRMLSAQCDYFCAMHSYLDFQRFEAFRFLIKAFRAGGLRRKYIVLLIKIVVGRKIIQKIKT